MREDVKQKHLATPLRETSMGACIQGPFFFVERILVFTAGERHRVRQGYGSQLLVSFEWFHAAVLDTIRCEAAQANRCLKCQPSSYVRLEAYGFFGLSEGA